MYVISVCMYVRMYVLNVCMYIINVCMYACMHVYIYIYTLLKSCMIMDNRDSQKGLRYSPKYW